MKIKTILSERNVLLFVALIFSCTSQHSIIRMYEDSALSADKVASLLSGEPFHIQSIDGMPIDGGIRVDPDGFDRNFRPRKLPNFKYYYGRYTFKLLPGFNVVSIVYHEKYSGIITQKSETVGFVAVEGHTYHITVLRLGGINDFLIKIKDINDREPKYFEKTDHPDPYSPKLDSSTVSRPDIHYMKSDISSIDSTKISSDKTGISPKTDTVTDIDGNTYITVKIGQQWWMAENLKVTRYRNGDTIPNVTGKDAWSNLTTAAYCDYDNNADNAATYGHLYNWYAVSDSRGLAPEGWHIPSDDEWKTLVDYLGGSSSAGGKIKESSTTQWESPNEGATNESGFSALLGGYRHYFGFFIYIGSSAYFWSSTVNHRGFAGYWSLDATRSEVYRGNYRKQHGFSVRCVRD